MATAKKLSDFGIKAPKQMNVSDVQVSTAMNTFSKWVPLICAGAAVGVSVLALKEIKNVRKELINLKKESLGSVKGSEQDPELLKRIELMDEQLRKITQYLANQNKPKESPIIKNVAKPVIPVKIINDAPEPEEEAEYEELEVTDDEAEA